MVYLKKKRKKFSKPFYPSSIFSDIYIYKLPIIFLLLGNDIPERRRKTKIKWKSIQAERNAENSAL